MYLETLYKINNNEIKEFNDPILAKPLKDNDLDKFVKESNLGH